MPMNELDPKTQKKLERLSKLKDDSDLVIMDAIDELEEKFDKTVEEIKANTPDLNQVLSTIKGQQGEKGETGETGNTPVKGTDYFTKEDIKAVTNDVMALIRIPEDGKPGKDGKDGRDGKDGYTPVFGVDYFNGVDGENGKDGRDGSPDSAGDIVKKLQSLKGNDRLDKSAIKGFEELEYRVYNFKPGNISSQVYHDSTLSGTGSQSDPLTVIGGGGGSQTLSQTLALGNTSGANDLIIDNGQRIVTPDIFISDGVMGMEVFTDSLRGIVFGGDVTSINFSNTTNQFAFSSSTINISDMDAAFAIYPDSTSGTYDFLVRDRGATYNVLELDDTGTLAVNNGTAKAIYDVSGITADRTFTLPDKNGTFAMLSDITGGGPTLETDGTPNGSQSLLNLIAGANITLTDDGLGGITIDSGGGASVAWGAITGILSSQTDLQTALDAKVDENGAIVGATKTKITYDSKGLVTAGADATTADIADSLNKRYVTDAQLTVLGNTSGTNTGDQTSVSGNAGTATALQNARTIGGVSFDGTANITVATATGGFTVSGGNLALGANSLTMTGSLGATGARVTKGWFTDIESTNMPTVGGTSLSSTFSPIAGSASITTVGTVGAGTWQGGVISSTYGGTGVNNGGRTLTINTNNGTISFTSAVTLTVANTASVSGTNTGDQTSVSGNAGTATALQTPRTIAGQSFDGTANISIASTDLSNSSSIALLTAVQALTNKDLTSGTNTFPTFNQNTTGSAAKWTTARNLAGNSVDGSANVAFANKFIVQGTADAGLSAAQFLGALGTGIVKNTTTTGVLSIAVAGDFPTLNQSTTGSAATLTTPRTIGGVSFDGSANITVATATGGFTVSGGNLALGANSLTLTGSIGATGARATKLWATDIESTNMPTVGGTVILSSLTAPSFSTSVSTPQVFNADNAVTATANAVTFTRANRNNVVTNNSAATLTITLSTTGAVAGDMLLIQIVDFSAVTQTITWVNTENSTVTAPVTSNGSTTLPLTVGFKWNALTSKWRCIASA